MSKVDSVVLVAVVLIGMLSIVAAAPLYIVFGAAIAVPFLLAGLSVAVIAGSML